MHRPHHSPRRGYILKDVANDPHANRLTPILDAARAGKLTLDHAFPNTFIYAPPRRLGCVLIVADNLSAIPAGPLAFHQRSLVRFFSAAGLVAISSGDAEPRTYNTAAYIAGRGFRVALVETQSSQHTAWLEFCERYAPLARIFQVIQNAESEQ